MGEKEGETAMKKAVLLLLALLLLLAAVGLFFYPLLKTKQIRAEEKKEAEKFFSYIEQSQSKGPTASEEIITSQEPFPELKEACVQYNFLLFLEEQRNLDGLTMTQPALQLNQYGYAQDVFCLLSCPSVGLEMPVYLGANESNLEKGCAVLGQTSLPVGGENTNCVIAGHRSWNAAIRFWEIENMETGDLVYIINPWGTLTYRVATQRTILSSSLAAIKIQPGKDLLTLFTCTNPNSHRYLVICERVETPTEK